MEGDNGYGNQGGFQDSFAPVKVGDEIDVKIESVGEKGDGLARKDGFVLFVPGVKEGDEVRIRITKVLRKVGFAESIGPASGPVAASEAPVRDTQDAQHVEQVPVEPPPPDTEDFGEEPTEEVPAEEEPAQADETPSEEEPVQADEVPAEGDSEQKQAE